jgi:hypothetical protein
MGQINSNKKLKLVKLSKAPFVSLLVVFLLLFVLHHAEAGQAEVRSREASEKAVQMYLVQHQMRFQQFEQAMAAVGPYLSEGLTSVQSREQLLQRMEETAHASRVAGALAALNGDAIPAMRLILQQQGVSEQQIQLRLPELLAAYEPTMNAVMFAKYEVLFDSMHSLYLYLDLHWDNWDAGREQFREKMLREPHQRLLSEVGEAMNLIAAAQAEGL